MHSIDKIMDKIMKHAKGITVQGLHIHVNSLRFADNDIIEANVADLDGAV